MADSITIACPECEKKITVAADAVGKKIRCKGCDHVFAVQPPAVKATKAPAKAGAKPPPGKRLPAKAARDKPDKAGKADKPAPANKAGDDDEENSNPYGVSEDGSGIPRCPNCITDLESEDQVICLQCGYNMQTRTRAQTRVVQDVTGGKVFLWLLPAFLCILGILFVFSGAVWYSFRIDLYVAEQWYEFLKITGVKIWVWVMAGFIMFFLGRFAFIRLVFHPRPPEVEKKPTKKSD